MERTAARVPFFHGTSERWPLLIPGIGKTILAKDPNPRAIYTMIARRDLVPHAEAFAREAVRSRGTGIPSVAIGKMDTAKGWRPQQLNREGMRSIGSLDDAHALVRELDTGAQEPRRGEIWKLLQQGTGAWRNENPEATLRPAGFRTVKKAYDDGRVAALRLYQAL